MRSLLPLLIVPALLTACRKTEVRDKSWVRAQIDSALRVQQAEIDSMAAEDLDQRIAIVVRQKVDSILEARRVAAARDTLKPPHPVP